MLKRLTAMALVMMLCVTGVYAESGAQEDVQDVYIEAWHYALGGEYGKAYELFSSIESHADSAELAYLLGVSQYAQMKSLGKGIIAYEFHGKWGMINLYTGALTIPEWDTVEKLNAQGYALVSQAGLYGYVDADGETVVPCSWNELSEFNDGFCVVLQQTRISRTRSVQMMGLVNDRGEIVVEPQWMMLGNNDLGSGGEAISLAPPVFENGRMFVRDGNGLYGMIGRDGKVLGTADWQSITPFSEAAYLVRKNDLYGFIDAQGNVVGEVTWVLAPDLTQEYPIVTNGTKQAFINRKGEVVGNTLYAAVQPFSEGLAAVQTEDGLWQYIDVNGGLAIPAVYAQAGSFRDGVAQVMLPRVGWQVIDQQGQVVYFVTRQMAKDYETAKGMMAVEDFAGAIDLLEKLIGYQDGYNLLTESRIQKQLQDDYAAAAAMMAEGRYVDAMNAYLALAGYKDADARYEQAREAAYQYAVARMEADQFALAIETFAALSGYKESDALRVKLEATYAEASEQMEQGMFIAAMQAFEKLDGYLDAGAKAQAAREAAYQFATAEMHADRYLPAIETFRALKGYRDAAEILAALEACYTNAVADLDAGKYVAAVRMLKKLTGYQDADALYERARELAYAHANEKMAASEYAEAIETFDAIRGYRDSDALREILEATFATVEALLQSERYDDAIVLLEKFVGYRNADNLLRQARIDKEKLEAYTAASILIEAEEYAQAIGLLETIRGYKDSDTLLDLARILKQKAAKYTNAQNLLAAGKYGDAINVLKELTGYKDADVLLQMAQEEKEKSDAYDAAKRMMAQGNEAGAIAAFGKLAGYRDSDALRQTMVDKYEKAREHIAKGEYAEAVVLLEKLVGYENAKELLEAAKEMLFGYTVEDYGSYGFKLNSKGYYESANKGKSNSYAMCKITFRTNTGYIYLDCINYAQYGKDYGLISKLDTALTKAYTVDRTTLVYKSFASSNTSGVTTIKIPVSDTKEHTIYVKFRKDGSTNSYNDSFQFKVRFK